MSRLTYNGLPEVNPNICHVTLAFPFGVESAFARRGDAFFTAFPACSLFVSIAKALEIGSPADNGVVFAGHRMPLRVGFFNQSRSFFLDKICAGGITVVSS